jgi:hypothetical protein
MEQFSSCYFCGDAVDASLGEYPVVPASVDPEAGDRRTIVLCTGCKRKLDPVVEAVVGVVGDDAVTVDRPGSDVREREDPSGESDQRGHETDDEETSSATDIGSTLGDDEDVLRSVGDGDDEASGMEFGRSPENSESASGSGATDEGESDDSSERGYSSGQRAGGRPTDGSGDDEDDNEDRKRDVTMTRLENTNVMRMMQNRDFPVDRDDFVVVASSAYEISPDRCEKVLDLAVKHDLLREQDGQLHAGANWS